MPTVATDVACCRSISQHKTHARDMQIALQNAFVRVALLHLRANRAAISCTDLAMQATTLTSRQT